jgi:hypothetical protein
MGGAGTWHIGLRHPSYWCAIAPGAGFTTTHGYIKGLPNPLPPYQEPLLHIYDALDYAENAFDVPVVAYSGEVDAQKAAADNIEKRLKELKIDSMTHMVAPGLAHSFPADWQKKVLVELDKYAGPGRGRAVYAERIRFITYSLANSRCGWLTIEQMENNYSEARVEGVNKGGKLEVKTKNVRVLSVDAPKDFSDYQNFSLTIDGQKVSTDMNLLTYYKTGKTWTHEGSDGFHKNRNTHGPIDDAFTGPFLYVKGTGRPGHEAMDQAARAQLDRFVREWDKWMRGKLEVKSAGDVTRDDLKEKNLILFGDFRSNFEIGRLLPDKLPITWNEKDLVVGGQRFDSAKHLPMLIYPNPNNQRRYIVLNSGHTFHEADFKGTNALLYPRLGDFAVVRPTPTDKDPAAFEVIKAGIFTDDWKFPEK